MIKIILVLAIVFFVGMYTGNLQFTSRLLSMSDEEFENIINLLREGRKI
jgi:hypothetical protein